MTVFFMLPLCTVISTIPQLRQRTAVPVVGVMDGIASNGMLARSRNHAEYAPAHASADGGQRQSHNKRNRHAHDNARRFACGRRLGYLDSLHFVRICHVVTIGE